MREGGRGIRAPNEELTPQIQVGGAGTVRDRRRGVAAAEPHAPAELHVPPGLQRQHQARDPEVHPPFVHELGLPLPPLVLHGGGLHGEAEEQPVGSGGAWGHEKGRGQECESQR
jgi:hypothetical protein